MTSFVPEMSATFTSYIAQNIWLGTCTHCILACFLWYKKPKLSSNHGLCCFSSSRPRLPL